MKWDIPGLCTIGIPRGDFSVAVHTDFEWPSADGFNLILSLYRVLQTSVPNLTTNRYSRYREPGHGSEMDVDLFWGKEKTTILIFAPKK